MTHRTIVATSEEIEFLWDEFDRLARVQSDINGRMQDNRYDIDGLRKRKLANEVLPQVKNGNSSTEHNVGISTSTSTPLTGSSGSPTVSYISGHMILGAEIDGDFVFHLGDALSTVRDVVDDQGPSIRSFEFDEYGNPISTSGSGTVSSQNLRRWVSPSTTTPPIQGCLIWGIGIMRPECLGGLYPGTRLGLTEVSISTITLLIQ